MEPLDVSAKPASKKEEIIAIMYMQWDAIVSNASIDQLDHLSQFINPELIANMDKLVEQEDIDLQFQRICKEIRDIGLANIVNEYIRLTYKTLRNTDD